LEDFRLLVSGAAAVGPLLPTSRGMLSAHMNIFMALSVLVDHKITAPSTEPEANKLSAASHTPSHITLTTHYHTHTHARTHTHMHARTHTEAGLTREGLEDTDVILVGAQQVPDKGEFIVLSLIHGRPIDVIHSCREKRREGHKNQTGKVRYSLWV